MVIIVSFFNILYMKPKYIIIYNYIINYSKYINTRIYVNGI